MCVGRRTGLDTVHAAEAGWARTLSVVGVAVGILAAGEGGKKTVEAGRTGVSASCNH